MSSARRARLAAVFAMVTLASRPLPVHADAPASSPAPVTSLAGVACTVPDTISADDAFAHVIDDARTLAFLSFVTNLTSADRLNVVARVTHTKADLSSTEFDRALAVDCGFAPVVYAAARLEYVLAKRWSAREALDLQDSIRLSLAALEVGDRVSRASRDAALAVFGTTLEELDTLIARTAIPPAIGASQSSGAPGCAQKPIDARAFVQIAPDYPSYAKVVGVSGQVQVEVELDVHGYVRSATLFKKMLSPSDAEGADLVSASILAAGASSYTPQFVNCKPQAGTYLFRAFFDIRSS